MQPALANGDLDENKVGPSFATKDLFSQFGLSSGYDQTLPADHHQTPCSGSSPVESDNHSKGTCDVSCKGTDIYR